MNIRHRTWEIVEVARPGDTASRAFDVAILTLIVLNVVAVIIGSVRSIQARWGFALDTFEAVSVGVFTLEYVARLWSGILGAGFVEAVQRSKQPARTCPHCGKEIE